MMIRPPRARGAVDDLGQLRAVIVLLVHPIAVGRFDEQVVRFSDRRRIGQHGPAEAAEIPAEEDRAPAGRGRGRMPTRAGARR